MGVSLNTNDQGLTTNPSYNSQLASCTLQPVLEIDIHRPDRIIFEGEKIEVTATEFSLIYLLAQNRGKTADLGKIGWRKAFPGSRYFYNMYSLKSNKNPKHF